MYCPQCNEKHNKPIKNKIKIEDIPDFLISSNFRIWIHVFDSRNRSCSFNWTDIILIRIGTNTEHILFNNDNKLKLVNADSRIHQFKKQKGKKKWKKKRKKPIPRNLQICSWFSHFSLDPISIKMGFSPSTLKI